MGEGRYPEATVDGFTIGMFREAIPPEPGGRWGTYAVQQPLPLTTDDEAAEYLRRLLPELRRRWSSWKNSDRS